MDPPLRRTLRRGAVSLALAALAAGPAHALAVPQPPPVVVGTGDPADARSVAADLRARGLVVTTIPRIGALQVSGDDTAAVRAALGDDPRVDWVEPSRERTLLATSVPLDPNAIDLTTGRTYSWNLDRIDGSEGLALAGTALPVTVAIVDSGVDVNHPDLAGRIGPTWDILTGTTAVKDFVGHGTFVAGLISAIDGNGLGSRGVAGATTVLPIRITSNGAIRSADSAAGIVRAVDAGAKVINLSFGGSTLSEVEKEALAYAAEKQVVVVAASGNSYAVTSPVRNPIQYPAAAIGGVRGGWSTGLSVAATDPDGHHAPFSTANDFVSVAAPGAGSGDCGDGVFSTIPAATTILWDGTTAGQCTRVVDALSTATGRYGYAEGTSFAAPQVAGAVALVRDVNPDLTAEQSTDVIKRSAHQTIESGWNPQTGWGVLDVDAAVALARVYDTADPVPSLTVSPRAGVLTVGLAGTDAARSGGTASGIASYRLERSGDGNIFTPVGSAQSTPIRIDDPAPSGERRWYRGTVCDERHNCAVALSGAVTSGTPKPPLSIARAVAPEIRAAAAGRPSTCRACVLVSFTARGTGPLKWAVTLSPGNSGVKPARQAGTVPAGGRVTTRLLLSRPPTCLTRITVSMTLGSPYGATRASERVSAGRNCVRRSRR